MTDPKDRIKDILEKYMNGTADAAEEREALDWLLLHGAESEYDNIFEVLLENEEAEIRAEDTRIRIPARGRRGIWGWACSCILAAALAAGAFLWPAKESPVEWYEAYAGRGCTERITLADGTEIWLNSETKVIYPSEFHGDSRNIFIDGEVYADVTPDSEKPFTMTSSGIRVKVHGTRFSLKSYSGTANIEVALLSGSVTVEDKDDTKGFTKTMKPGEMIRYNRTYGTMEQYAIDPATYGPWQNNHNLRFINQSLEDIANDLERRFDVEIIIEDRALARTQYYASFVNNEGLDKILNALNSNGSMKISRRQDTIVISAR